MSDDARVRSEGLIVLLVGAIQFINILDFVIPMPMGPDLAHGLGIPNSQIGLIGGSYTAAAAVSGPRPRTVWAAVQTSQGSGPAGTARRNSAQRSGAITTGMRSCSGASRLLAFVVMMAKDLIVSPCGERHDSHKPARTLLGRHVQGLALSKRYISRF